MRNIAFKKSGTFQGKKARNFIVYFENLIDDSVDEIPQA